MHLKLRRYIFSCVLLLTSLPRPHVPQCRADKADDSSGGMFVQQKNPTTGEWEWAVVGAEGLLSLVHLLLG